ncbi:hypothetical protein KAR29_04875 [Aminithiophilus ramosus]|uniref:Uncharacterized protein n=1 Tax=Aminithiophilus ramosus TaxID=3029084 RepID=A0A9Q7AKK0_9BACT|nr:hypothetical protein [Aminithiophilus ramosus]QTX33230.1 hypothetical protein KAR29_04875 [Aminithiophilus ramosus]
MKSDVAMDEMRRRVFSDLIVTAEFCVAEFNFRVGAVPDGFSVYLDLLEGDVRRARELLARWN